MQKLELTQAPAASASMIIRKPPEEVLEAFADPSVTTRFWYSRSSGRMVPGAELRWEWETYGASVQVRVEAVEEGRLIRFQWGNYEQPTLVELKFTPQASNATFVEVTETGFQGSGDDAVRWVNDTVGGFTTVLCALKALLEHGIELGAVADHHPV
ncbi:SRPBCC family protein [Streptomyces sp. MST-110588]|uniref:SRPBCC family protein n=1 Tax=Streptomyces sp. MST-110588 TaxID=2833628 RepID=UPI001F5D85BA|nr:SRPBCC family protein [Streptomyces sp. MST-110588]UNO39102.1 SRPBCC family protein [Streptomyces sp. MST-110588]